MVAGQSFSTEIWMEERVAPGENRPDIVMGRYNFIFCIDDEYYGIQEERIYNAIYDESGALVIDAEIEVLEGEFASSNPDITNLKVTLTNSGTDEIKNLYLEFWEEDEIISWDTMYSFSPQAEIVYYFSISGEYIDVFTAYVQHDYIHEIGSYTYYIAPMENGKQLISGCWSFRDDEFSDYRGSQFLDYMQRKSLEEETTDLASTPAAPPQIIYVTPEPEPTPPAKVIYVIKNTTIPLWIWPILSVAIVLAGALVLWIRRKQNNEERGEKTDEKSS